ncbi:expressed unknown protein [Seminavis robusta]|uniref:Uncharacterized protein n=1 Tax=Seminavis robusta TaxID=568900 RepID=A0A9N8H6A9_9STRA|nr:expressed unknown protein [Seminavis robusta]|eukprot:Sro140_g065600.1 n/a (477) ;mRNA; r:94121-95551
MGNIQTQHHSEGKERRLFFSSTPSHNSKNHATTTPKPDYVFGTLCLNSYADVSRALKKKQASMIPRRLQMGGKFLNCMTDFPSKHHKRMMRRVLRRGCLEIALAGSKPRAPRRVYENELSFVLSHLQQEWITHVQMENLDIQPLVANSNNNNSRMIRNALSKLQNLETLTIESTRMTMELLQDILKVLEQSLPNLEHLTLNVFMLSQEEAPNQQHVMEATVTKLIQQERLQSLALPFYPTSLDFWKAVTTSTKLNSLSMDCHNMTNLKQIKQVLLDNTSSLQKLELSNLPSETKDNDMVTLTQGLKRNQTLKALTLILSSNNNNKQQQSNNNDDTHSLRDEGIESKTNTAPGIFATSMTEHAQATRSIPELLTPVLEQDNFTLQDFELYRDDNHEEELPLRIATPELEFYTQLNRKERSHLMRGSSTEREWKQALITAATCKSRRHYQYSETEDLATLYYWLRVQPTQWCCAEQQQ